MARVKVKDILAYADGVCAAGRFDDYPMAHNGLQFGDGSGYVDKIACAVDAGLAEFKAVAKIGTGLLVVHHGLYWDFPLPIVGSRFEKVRVLAENKINLYSQHLPLDAHPELGNNAQIAKALKVKAVGTCGNFGGCDIAAVAEAPKGGRRALAGRLKKLFPKTFKAIEFGSDSFEKFAICSGSSGEIVAHLKSYGVDTLVCGELRQRHYTAAQEQGLNLYPCGHYCTEVFGVKALCEAISKEFGIPFSFIPMGNPL